MLTNQGFSPEVRQAQETGWGQTASKAGPPSISTERLEDYDRETYGGVNIQGSTFSSDFGVNLSLNPVNNYYSPLFNGTPVTVNTTLLGGGSDGGGDSTAGILISQFHAIVSGATSISAGRWSYTLEVATLAGTSYTGTGDTLSALNELEGKNTSSFQSGYAISGGYVQLSSATSLTIQPIPNGTVVIASIVQDATSGDQAVIFSQQNPFGGSLGGGSSFFYAKVTASTSAGSGKWTYNWTTLALDTSGNFTTPASPVSGSATNDLEEKNTSTSHASLPVASNGRLIDFPGYQLQPIPDNTVIQVGVSSYTNASSTTSYKYTFRYPNPVKNSSFPNNWFWAKITASSAITGAPGRWTYSFTEQIAATGVSTTTLTFSNGSNSGTAFNEWEAGNTSSLQGGYPISSGYIDGATGFNIAPIPVNAIVRMRVEQVATGDGTTPYNLRYMFNAPNPVIGSCQ